MKSNNTIMQREILFRGKRIDNGNWVYGYLINKIKPTEKEPTFWCSLIHDGALTAVVVIPETVGQFTGLPVINKDGIEEQMYKGDILVVDDDVIGYVDWEYNRWVVRVNLQCGLKEIGSWSDWVKLGNIHDNPELLNTK